MSPVSGSRPIEPQTPDLNGLPQALQLNSAQVIVAFVDGFFEGDVSPELPLQALSLGLDTLWSNSLIAASGLARQAAMLPSSLWVDHRIRRRAILGMGPSDANRADLMQWCTSVTVVFTLAMPGLEDDLPLAAVVVVFVWGGAGGGLYTISVIDIGERVFCTPLFEATAVLLLVYARGTIMGPLVGAATMQWGNSLGFPMLLLTVSTRG